MSETNWQTHARWQLGELSDEEYAATLEGDPDAEELRALLLRRSGRQPTRDDRLRELNEGTGFRFPGEAE